MASPASPAGDSSLTFASGGNRLQKTPSGRTGSDKRVKGVESDQNPTNSCEIIEAARPGAAKASVAVSLPMSADADLGLIAHAWPALPEPVRADIVAMVKAVQLEVRSRENRGG